MRHVVFVDKPKGLTSRECVDKVKDRLKARKAGHSGTLDREATGVLLVALDEAVKAMPVLVGLDKEYTGEMLLHTDSDKEKIEKARLEFIGKVKQMPPIKSAVARKERERQVYSFDIFKIKGREIEFKIRCEAGFYIRKLCHDFGQKLGCGAHMTELRRTAIGPFTEKGCVKLGNLEKGDAIRLESILDKVKLKRIILNENELKKIKNGNSIEGRGLEYVGLYDGENIVAIGLCKNGKIKPERIFL